LGSDEPAESKHTVNGPRKPFAGDPAFLSNQVSFFLVTNDSMSPGGPGGGGGDVENVFDA